MIELQTSVFIVYTAFILGVGIIIGFWCEHAARKQFEKRDQSESR